jgi:acetyltransferase
MVPRLGLDATFSHLVAQPGDVAFLSQSGAMMTSILDWAIPRGIGCSHVVALGEMADVDFGDLLDYLAADRHTRSVLIDIEGVTNGRKFMSAARRASRIKPVLVLKAGRTNAGVRAATPHAVADAVYEAAFRRSGMLRVGTIAEVFSAAETLALTRAQVGDRLAILSNGGAAGVLATDALIAAGGHLATLSKEKISALDRLLSASWSRGNPVDILGDASGKRYADALAVLIGDREVDAILMLNCPTGLAQPDEAARAVIGALKTAEPTALRGRNVITAWLGEASARPARQLFADARIAAYESPDSAVSFREPGTPSRQSSAVDGNTAGADRRVRGGFGFGTASYRGYDCRRKILARPEGNRRPLRGVRSSACPQLSRRGSRQVPRRLLRALASQSLSRSAARILGSKATSAA